MLLCRGITSHVLRYHQKPGPARAGSSCKKLHGGLDTFITRAAQAASNDNTGSGPVQQQRQQQQSPAKQTYWRQSRPGYAMQPTSAPQSTSAQQSAQQQESQATQRAAQQSEQQEGQQAGLQAAQQAVPTQPVKAKRTRRAAAPPAGDGSEQQATPARKPRSQKPKAEAAAVPFIPEPPVEWGTPVLSQAAVAIETMVNELGFTDVREILADLGSITVHTTALKHIMSVLDAQMIDEAKLLQLYYLDKGPEEGLTFAAVEQALQAKAKAKTKKLDAVLKALEQEHDSAMKAQEQARPGITLLQIDLVKQLVKRRAAPAGDAGESGSAPEPTLESELKFRMGNADLTRLKGYLAGRSLQEIREPPYSRKQVKFMAAVETLVNACKEGVVLPVDRVLADMKLATDPAAGLTAFEVGSAMGRCLHLLHQGLQGKTFYGGARSDLLANPETADKVLRQEKEDPLGAELTYQQIRLVYYMTVSGTLPATPDWAAAMQQQQAQ